MDNTDLTQKATSAMKWSFMTQVAIKLVLPISTIVLAHILAPEAFGVVAVITMITNFTDVFTDAGFQKYIIQHSFTSKDELDKALNVAFWSNLILSLSLWGIIIVFNEQLAKAVGCAGYGLAIVIACAQIPITTFSSIQIAFYQKEFGFKDIFYVQLAAAVIPFIVTIPLALLGFGFWSIIIGNLSGALEISIFLTIKSKWKPKYYYKIRILKDMFSFCSLSILSDVTVWFNSWTDSFIIGNQLNTHYLGIYRNSQSLVNCIISVFQYSANPILLTTLSKVEDFNEFNRFFLRIQRMLAYILLPIGVGIFMYQDTVTLLAFGSKWSEASSIIGIWSITSVFRTLMVSICSTVFIAKGEPKLSFWLQLVDLAIVIPTCIIGLQHGFQTLVYARSLIKLDLIIPIILIFKYRYRFKLKDMLKNFDLPVLFVGLMTILILLLKQIGNGVYWDLISIFICIAFYGVLFVTLAKNEFNILKSTFFNNRNT
jgi:PST family polysaccharide transporter